MSDFTIAETIIAQLGGLNKLQAMVGAHTFVADDESIQFKFKGSRKVNICRVKLMPSDTYLFELYKFNNRTYDLTKVYELDGVYWDMLIKLFEDKTKLYLTI